MTSRVGYASTTTYIPCKQENQATIENWRLINHKLNLSRKFFTEQSQSLTPPNAAVFIKFLEQKLADTQALIDNAFTYGEANHDTNLLLQTVRDTEALLATAFSNIAELDAQGIMVDKLFESVNNDIQDTVLTFSAITIGSVEGSMLAQKAAHHLVPPVSDRKITNLSNKAQAAETRWKQAVSTAKQVEQQVGKKFVPLADLQNTHSELGNSKTLLTTATSQLQAARRKQVLEKITTRVAGYAGSVAGGVIGVAATILLGAEDAH